MEFAITNVIDKERMKHDEVLVHGQCIYLKCFCAHVWTCIRFEGQASTEMKDLATILRELSKSYRVKAKG